MSTSDLHPLNALFFLFIVGHVWLNVSRDSREREITRKAPIVPCLYRLCCFHLVSYFYKKNQTKELKDMVSQLLNMKRRRTDLWLDEGSDVAVFPNWGRVMSPLTPPSPECSAKTHAPSTHATLFVLTPINTGHADNSRDLTPTRKHYCTHSV